LGVYGGAQGIWIDKVRTASPESYSEGATVAILHTGRHYNDDLSDDGVIYHYPVTSRGAKRDAGEVQATKNAMSYQLPIFVILPGKLSEKNRSLKLGWVCDFDDENQQFLILFGAHHPHYAPAEQVDAPFTLKEEVRRKTASVLARPSQQRFRFNVLAKYGSKCSVCEIRHPQVLKAAHICGKSDKGSDDWRNGLPLCATHHDAFDVHLFSIEPTTMEIRCRPNVAASDDLGLHVVRLASLHNMPHVEALAWRWAAAQKEWNTKEQQSEQS
jgi:putative restriction endonuclease